MGCCKGDPNEGIDMTTRQSPTPTRLRQCQDVIWLILFIACVGASFYLCYEAQNFEHGATTFQQWRVKGADDFGNLCDDTQTGAAAGAGELYAWDSDAKFPDAVIQNPGFHFHPSQTHGSYLYDSATADTDSMLGGSIGSGYRICVDSCPGAGIPAAIYADDEHMTLLAAMIITSHSDRAAFVSAATVAFSDVPSLVPEDLAAEIWCEDVFTNAGSNAGYGGNLTTDGFCDDYKVLLPTEPLGDAGVSPYCMPHRSLLKFMATQAAEASDSTWSVLLTQVKETMGELQGAIIKYQQQIMLGCLCSIGIGIIVIFIIQVFTKWIIYLIVTAFFLTSLAGTGFVWFQWAELAHPDKIDDFMPMCDRADLYTDPAMRDMAKVCETYNGSTGVQATEDEIAMKFNIACVVSVVAGIIMITICCCCNNIRLAVTLFDEAGKCVFAMPGMLLQPFFILLIIGVACLVYAWQLIYTSQVGVPTRMMGEIWVADGKVRWLAPDYFWKYSWVFTCFAFFWVEAFLIGMHQTVLAGTVSNWYFTHCDTSSEKPKCIARCRLCPGKGALCDLLKFNLGSVALGSFLIAVIKTIRIIIWLIEKSAKKKGSDSKLMKYIFACVKCLLACITRFLTFLNRNAYIGVAMFGYSFCRAAQKALALKIENAGRAVMICMICMGVLFLGKLVSTIASAYVTYKLILIDNPEIATMQLTALSLIVAIFAYLIINIFLSVYEMALDTIFLCFCEDQNRNNGRDRPYFSSAQLQKFMRANA